MKKIATLLLVFSCLYVFSQHSGESLFSPRLPDYIPQSPTAFELGKYGDIPVNESSGVANIGIPLMTFSTPNLSVPVSLSYTTSGIKVNQVSSWVGTGWNLNANGVITRSVRGMADEDAQQRSFPSYAYINSLKTSNPSQYYDFIKQVGDKNYTDYVPDIYNVNVQGVSTSFYLNENNMPVIIKNESKLKIELLNNFFVNGFIVTDANGISYTFSVTESTKQRMACGSGPNPTTFKVTSWFLTKITHPLGDEIYFEYNKNTNYMYKSSLSETYTKKSGVPNADPTRTKCRYDSYVQGKVLTKIYSNRNVGSIVFESSNRSDLAGDYKLDAVKRYDNQQQLITNYHLGYSNIQSSVSYNGATTFPSVSNIDGQYRLFLMSVQEKDRNGNIVNGKKHSFEYELPHTLPRRLSLSQDLLGFYNGKSNLSLLPNTAAASLNITGGDRSFDINYATRGILKKIIYPTKGYTSFDYESGYSGIRIKRVRSVSNTGQDQIKKYYYTSKEHAISNNSSPVSVPFGTGGFIRIKPVYHMVEVLDENGEVYNHIIETYDLLEFTTNGRYPLYMTSKDVYVYDKVTIGYGENFEGGGVEKRFSATVDNMPLLVYGEAIYNSTKTNTGIFNGTLLQETSFSKQNNLPVVKKEVRHVYKVDASKSSTIANYVGEIIYEYPQSEANGSGFVRGYNVGSIETLSKWRAIDSVITKEFHGNTVISNIQKYHYQDGYAGLPNETIVKNGKGETIKTKYYYPQSTMYANSLGYDNLTSAELQAINSLYTSHQFPVLQTEVSVNIGNSELSKQAKRTNYHITQGFSLPKELQINKKGNSLENRVVYHRYDDKGNPQEVSQADGTRVYYVWGYHQTQPIAKITNLKSTDITSYIQNKINLAVSASNSDDDSCGYGVSCSEATLRTRLKQLQDALPNSQMVYYTYNPSVGVTSITDARGYTSYYEYDAFNRLKQVKDGDAKILSTNVYNYKTQE